MVFLGKNKCALETYFLRNNQSINKQNGHFLFQWFNFLSFFFLFFSSPLCLSLSLSLIVSLCVSVSLLIIFFSPLFVVVVVASFLF